MNDQTSEVIDQIAQKTEVEKIITPIIKFVQSFPIPIEHVR